MNSEPYLTPEEVAQIARCHPKTINRMARNGEIPARKFGHRWRFLRSQLDEWFIRGDNQAAQPRRVEGGNTL